MLEVGRTYTRAELVKMFGNGTNQGLTRKLTRNGIAYRSEGRGQEFKITVTGKEKPFKVFCMNEFGLDGRTDYQKLRNFYYYFFNDEEFRAMPDEVKEARMEAEGKHLSRQTITRYTELLRKANLMEWDTTRFVYYFAYKNTQRIVERSEYSQAWKEYWETIAAGCKSFDAICDMRFKYGGVARKQAIPEFNGIYNDKITHLMDLIQQSIEEEIERGGN